MYSREQCNAIRTMCQSQWHDKFPVPQSEKNHSRPQVAFFRYWDKLTNDAHVERAYLNIQSEGSKYLPDSIGFVDLNSGEITMTVSEAYWDKIVALFEPLIAQSVKLQAAGYPA